MGKQPHTKTGKLQSRKGSRGKSLQSRLHHLPGMLRYVMAHMDDAEMPAVSKHNAGGKGAYNLLKWVRENQKNRDIFMRKVLDQLFSPEQDGGKEDEPTDVCVSLVDELLKTFNEGESNASVAG